MWKRSVLAWPVAVTKAQIFYQGRSARNRYTSRLPFSPTRDVVDSNRKAPTLLRGKTHPLSEAAMMICCCRVENRPHYYSGMRNTHNPYTHRDAAMHGSEDFRSLSEISPAAGAKKKEPKAKAGKKGKSCSSRRRRPTPSHHHHPRRHKVTSQALVPRGGETKNERAERSFCPLLSVWLP
jgi:hypothetical protein